MAQDEVNAKVEISESLLTDMRKLTDLIEQERKKIEAAIKEFERQKRGAK